MEDRLEQEFATYEQALALKELGFDEWCFLFWYKSEPKNLLLRRHDHIVRNNKCLPAPLKQQVFRWFRDNHNLDFHIMLNWMQNYFKLTYILSINYPNISNIDFNTYEEAENACIDKLIELTKTK